MAVLVGPAIVLIANLLLKYVSWGNPRVLVAMSQLYVAVSSAPPETLFRWRVGAGLRVVVYDEKTDEERELASGLVPDRWGPGLVFWMWGDRPRSAAFVAQRIRFDFLIRLFCFIALLLNGVAVGVRLAVTENPLWLAAVVFLVVHQVATAATRTYIFFMQPVYFIVMVVGVFGFLREGTLQTVAVWAVSGFFVLGTLAIWYVRTSSRMQDRYRLHGRFDRS